MRQQIGSSIKFQIERLILRGAHYRLLVIAALIGLLSVLGGAIVHFFHTGIEGGFADAVWWAFLRLSDPGYLGDDTGTLQRFVSTILTVLGYVVFLGALVAIMTQWLNQRMRELEAGLTPIAQNDHILLIGWTNRTSTIVRELVLSESRVQRFLQLRGARRLRIAILAEEVTSALRVELRDRLGQLWNERQVTLRTGSALRLEHLRRVDFIHASAVIMPAADFASAGPQQADTHTIKTLLSMTNHPLRDGGELPLAVAEIFDARKMDVALRAYGGPIEILASDAIISRLIAQNVRHRGLSHVYGEMLTHGRGNEIYIRDCPEQAGRPFGDAAASFEQAIALGVVRRDGAAFQPLLNPDPALVLEPHDRLALLARSYKATVPGTMTSTPTGTTNVRSAEAPPPELPQRRVLVLGWSHKVPALLQEFDSYEGERFNLQLVSTVPIERREAALARYDFRPQRVSAHLVEDDYTTPSLLRRIDLASFDNIVLLGSDSLGSGEESDARTILGYLLLRDVLPPGGGPAVLVELLDPGNAALFRRRSGEVIISPMILSHMLAQVALRRELRVVFDELFGPLGSEIRFADAAEYALPAGAVTFSEIEAAARARGEIALGVRAASSTVERGGGIALNPPRERTWELAEGDQVIALR